MSRSSAGSRYQIESVVRACRVLQAFRGEGETLRLQDLAGRAKLPSSTTLRIVRTLEECGFLSRAAPRIYRSLVRTPSRVRRRIGYVVDTAGRPFRSEVTEGLEQAAAEHSVDLIRLDHRGDRRTALRDADTVIRAGVDLVIDFQTGYDLAASVAEKYADAGIPWIAVDVPHPGATFFGVNNFVAGLDGGRWLGEWARRRWKGRMDRAVLLGRASAGVAASRVRGALTGIQEKLGRASGLRVEQLGVRGDFKATFESLQRFFARRPEGRSVVVAPSDPATIAALTAMEESGGKSDCVVLGFGGNHETRMALRRPGSRLICCVGFLPERYGEKLLLTAMRILDDQPTPPAVFVEHTVMTCDNVDLLYPNDLAAAGRTAS